MRDVAGGRLWEQWEIEALLACPYDGLADLARRLGRTPAAIRHKRAAYGLTQPSARWTDAERSELHARVRAGESVQSVAAALGRSRSGAYARRLRCRRGEVGETVPAAPQPAGRGYRGARHPG